MSLERAIRVRFELLLAFAIPFLGTTPAAAQRAVSLDEAVATAAAFVPHMAVARADSAAARANLDISRGYPNPSLSLSYSTSVPHHHVELDQPIEYPWVRARRISAAHTAAEAASALVAAERATIRYSTRVAYVRAAAAAAVLSLSRQNSADAAELLDAARMRQSAGDASELEVDLAALTAGQARSTLLSDSLLTATALADLQVLMGLSPDEIVISLSDSLATLTLPAPSLEPETALRIEAARLQVNASNDQLSYARRNRFPAPSILLGFEHGDPDEPGLLPTAGISFPIPIFNRGGGEVAQARADAERAAAELVNLEGDTETALTTARRNYEVAQRRLAVDDTMMISAERVSSLSLTAYREGAYSLANVLEAQRNARDATRRFIEDQEASHVARAALLLAQTVGGMTP